MTRTIDSADLKLQLREVFGKGFVPGHNGIVGTVAPQTEAELRKLILCTRESGVSLTPRGAGTSPFVGAVASEGVILSFERLSAVIDIDQQAELARVQPGVVWRELMNQLRPLGLMPRIHPSSAAYSTVGGFVAQGGVGVGSFQFGSIGDCVQSVRMLAGNGDTIELNGKSVGLAVGAEGRTGILVEVTLRLQPLAAMEPVVAVFSRVDEIEGCLANLARRELPLWSISMMDRSAVDLQSKLRPDGFELPQGRYAALFSFRVEDRKRVLPKLRGCILASGGKPIAGSADHDAWTDHFMGLQALGTTPVPMQFRVPLGKLAELAQAIQPELRRKLAFEGVMAGVAKSVTVRFFLTDRPETAEDNLLVAHELLRLAKQVGGEVHATGAVFLEEAEAVFGAEHLSKMILLGHALDPDGRFNPGKAFEPEPPAAARQ